MKILVEMCSNMNTCNNLKDIDYHCDIFLTKHFWKKEVNLTTTNNSPSNYLYTNAIILLLF